MNGYVNIDSKGEREHCRVFLLNGKLGVWRGTTRLDCSLLDDNNSTHYYWFLISFIILNSSSIGWEYRLDNDVSLSLHYGNTSC